MTDWNETPRTVWAWARISFAKEGMTDRYIITRAIDELHEALAALDISEENTHKCALEATDAIIVLYNLFGKYGYDLPSMINDKMVINRARKWHWKGGQWRHVPDAEDEDASKWATAAFNDMFNLIMTERISMSEPNAFETFDTSNTWHYGSIDDATREIVDARLVVAISCYCFNAVELLNAMRPQVLEYHADNMRQLSEEEEE